MTGAEDEAQPLLTFHGSVRIVERRTVDGAREYVVTPLSGAAVLEELAAARERAAWYAGVDVALREAERLAVAADGVAVAVDHLRAALEALRFPRDDRYGYR